jgi:hypothetical protein
MLNMLGRLMWVAIGALGVKAWQAAEEDQRRKGGTAGGTTTRPRSRKRSASNGS